MASAGEAHILHVYMHMCKIARRVRRPCTAGLDPGRAQGHERMSTSPG